MKKIKYLLFLLFLFNTVSMVYSGKFLLKDWQYCILRGAIYSEVKPLDMTNPINEDILKMKKGDTVYYWTTIDLDKINDLSGLYFGKIEGDTRVIINSKMYTSLYNTQTIYFNIKKEDLIPNIENEILIKIKKNIPGITCNFEVIPYLDDYKNIRTNFLLLYFFQVLIGICLFLLGIYFIIFYNKKSRKTEFLFFFILCLFSSINTIIESPFKMFLIFNFSIDYLSIEKLDFLTLYVQPFIGFIFLIKLFKEKSLAINILFKILIMVTGIQILTILILNLEQISIPLFIFRLITIFYVILYGYLVIKNMLIKPNDTRYILFGGIILCLSILLTIAGAWKIINFGNRFSFYAIGMIVFTFSFVIHLSKQFSKIDNNLSELTINLEKKVEERTRQIELIAEQKTNFFINIAHDLKTPLTFIENYIDRDIETRGISEPIKIVKYNLSKLKREIINILDVERINNRKYFSNIKTVNLSKILKSSIDLFSEPSNIKKITIDSIIDCDVFIKIDPYDLDRVIFNLLDNAVKYTNENGLISVVLKKDNDKALFTVEDTGIGISQEEKENIFKPYYQINFNTANRQGIGMGLFIVKQVLDSINIPIIVDSEINKGTRFTIKFDFINKNENGIIVDKIDHIKPLSSDYKLTFKQFKYDESKRTLLIVEDNKELLFYLYDSFLEKYNVYYAVNGNEALARINIIPKPDLIISDVVMNEMDGFEFYDRIKKDKNFYDIPLIFLTGKSNYNNKIKGLKKGAVDFIIKPFKIKELVLKVDSIINNRLKLEMKNKSNFRYQILNALHEEKIDNNILSSMLYEKNITRREAEVIGLLLKGKEIKEIGSELNLSSSGVKKRINSIYKKFDINNKIELINYINSKDKGKSEIY